MDEMGLVRLYRSPLFEHIQKYLLDAPPRETVFLFVPYIQAEVRASDVIFTSGATEANNLAITGLQKVGGDCKRTPLIIK